MRTVAASLAALTLLGCGGRSYKVDNPVVGPPPPRVRSGSELAGQPAASVDPAANAPQSGVATVSLRQDSAEEPPLEMTEVAARVNGRAILVGDVLLEFRRQLELLRQTGTPEEQNKLRAIQVRLIKEHLPSHIEQALMVDAVKQKLTAEQIEQVDAQLDKYFEEHLDELRGKTGASSLVELETILQRQGLSLPVMRRMFGEKQLAQQYLGTKLGDPPHVSRAEILRAYREREAEFTTPPRVRWQQIQLSFKRFEGEQEARQTAKDVVAALQQGESFDELARRFSDGPDAASGGRWDWTEVDGLAEELRGPLSELQPGRPSGVITTARSLQIVQVLEREPSRVRPFEEVQNEIHQQLLSDRRAAEVERVMEELRATAVITTMFDESPEAGSAGPADRRPGVVKFTSD